MGFGKLFYYIVTLPHLWINEGLPQTGWKSKVKVDLVFLPLVPSLPSCPPHTAQSWSQARGKSSSHLHQWSQGAHLALLPASLLAMAQHTTCSAKQEECLCFILCGSLVAACGDDGTLQRNTECIWDGGGKTALRSLANNPWLMQLYCSC